MVLIKYRPYYLKTPLRGNILGIADIQINMVVFKCLFRFKLRQAESCYCNMP